MTSGRHGAFGQDQIDDALAGVMELAPQCDGSCGRIASLRLDRAQGGKPRLQHGCEVAQGAVGERASPIGCGERILRKVGNIGLWPLRAELSEPRYLRRNPVHCLPARSQLAGKRQLERKFGGEFMGKSARRSDFRVDFEVLSQCIHGESQA